MHPLDAPAEDDKPTTSLEPSRASIASFWIGIAGVAIFSIVAANAIQWRLLQFLEYSASFFPGAIWRNKSMVRTLAYEGLLPSVVTASLIPLLFWRGGLTQRVGISVVFALLGFSSLGYSFDNSNRFASRWLSVLVIAICWILLPILFLYSPIKSRSLRTVVAILLLAIASCFSVISMLEIPRSARVIYWEAAYGSAIAFALLLRNWGRTALLESGATNSEIERTSSRTMLEIMAVCAVGCSFAMYWGQYLHRREKLELYLGCGLLLGVTVVLLNIRVFSLQLGVRLCERWKIIAEWILLWLASGGLYVAITFALDGYHYASQRLPPGTRTNDILSLILLAAMVSSGISMSCLFVITSWLRLCGWRLAEKRGGKQDDF